MAMDKQKLYASLDENGIVENFSTINYSHSVMEYSQDDKSITNNGPSVGAKYDTELNAFIPPKPDPTYILNTKTFEWEPDENLTYDLHGDGIMYRWIKMEWVLADV